MYLSSGVCWAGVARRLGALAFGDAPSAKCEQPVTLKPSKPRTSTVESRRKARDDRVAHVEINSQTIIRRSSRHRLPGKLCMRRLIEGRKRAATVLCGRHVGTITARPFCLNECKSSKT